LLIADWAGANAFNRQSAPRRSSGLTLSEVEGSAIDNQQFMSQFPTGRTSTLPPALAESGRHLNGFAEIPRVEQVEPGHCSFVSANGPSVTDTLPPRMRTVAAVPTGRSLGGDQQAALPESVAARHALAVGHRASFSFSSTPGTDTNLS
jgi:hypothetical protein